ncbi:MAG TPA: hydroxymethylbilane synthase [Elusimicrobiota bacterium]|nr:hydroxymethylbilane synthase [Elusimicrobiota bacterium]
MTSDRGNRKHIRLGTRRSALARAQSEWVAQKLQAAHPDIRIDTVLITTSGDRRTATAERESALTREPTPTGGLKALFTKEIEDALLDGRIDLAVHSMKDLPSELPDGLLIAAVPRREDPRDAWISKVGRPFRELPQGARVGTGSVRRQAQLRHHRPDLEVVPLSGNVDTRLERLRVESWDGIVLAAAGLRRLGRATETMEALPPEIMVPAVGQGALAIEIRSRDAEPLRMWLASMDDPDTHCAVRAERAFSQRLGGGCQSPIAAYAGLAGTRLSIVGVMASRDGAQLLRERAEGSARDAETIGRRLAETLLGRGGAALLA